MCVAIRSFAKLCQQFRNDQDGQIAVIFALALMPAAIGVGAAVD